MVRILMHGCNGKMGQVITGLVKDMKQAKIVAGIDRYDGIPNDYPVFQTFHDCDVEFDVIIDFSNAAAIDPLLEYAVAKKVPVVLCTTGLSEEQLNKVEEASKTIAILRSANMSLGVNTLFELVKAAAKVLATAGFDMEIVERHHNQKVDAPSGTAIAFAEALNEAMNHEYHYVYDRSSVREKRDEKEIGLSAVRGGTIVGEHEIIFAGPDEVVELKHTAYSKAIFGKGALEAAVFLAGKPAGMYDMSHVIKK